MESVWVPASLLPENGVDWEQTGPDTARLTCGTGIEPVDLTLAEDGRVLEVVTMRWSDVNADRTFRLRPIGGTMETEQAFGGYTIPSELKIGNLYGSADYFPFFQARITAAGFPMTSSDALEVAAPGKPTPSLRSRLDVALLKAPDDKE